MPELVIQMFGRFSLTIENFHVDCFHSQKALELFCFLVLFHNQPHHRDQLADLFWGDHCTSEAKKYFRKTLWQLQTAFEQLPASIGHDLIRVETDWLQFNYGAEIRLDLLEFQQIYQVLSDLRGRQLDEQGFLMAQRAMDLYKGDLLEGCYSDWCIYERERLKDMFFVLVEKLMGYCEYNHHYEAGILYGKKLLGLDHARESTHLRLMRLYYLSGDRTGALRQFELCRQALLQDFDIEPGSQTVEVYCQIREDKKAKLAKSETKPLMIVSSSPASVEEVLQRIKELLSLQAAIPQELLKEIQMLEEMIGKSR